MHRTQKRPNYESIVDLLWNIVHKFVTRASHRRWLNHTFSDTVGHQPSPGTMIYHLKINEVEKTRIKDRFVYCRLERTPGPA